jgi:hypothetical protein
LEPAVTRRCLLFAAISALTLWCSVEHAVAQDSVDRIKAAAFDTRVFTGPVGVKSYACFVRQYDADHLAQHPKQKVSAMKLLVAAEKPPGEPINYSFRLGIKYRHRSGNFDSSGYCNHTTAEASAGEIRFGCGVDCEGGGIEVALSKDDTSAIVRLERITVWNRDKPDPEAGDALLAGADDRIFRVDRAEASECAELVTDRKELAALRHK